MDLDVIVMWAGRKLELASIALIEVHRFSQDDSRVVLSYHLFSIAS